MRFDALELRFSGFELIFGIQRIALELGIAEFENDRIGPDGCAGMKNDFADAGGVEGGNPLDIFGNKSANAVNGAKEIAALDGIRKKGSAIDTGSGGAETSQRICRDRDAKLRAIVRNGDDRVEELRSIMEEAGV